MSLVKAVLHTCNIKSTYSVLTLNVYIKELIEHVQNSGDNTEAGVITYIESQS